MPKPEPGEPDVGGLGDLLHAGAVVGGGKYPAATQRSEILQRSPYHYLLEDADVKRWFRNVKRGSPDCLRVDSTPGLGLSGV